MSFDLRRLRTGDLVAGASGAALLILLFALKWYEHGSAAGASGWHTIAHLRWLLLATGVIALGAVALTATQRTPALPVAAGVLTTLVGVVALIWLVYRVLISPPGANGHGDVDPGAYLSLVAGAGVVLGAWWSIRDESPGRVPTPPPGAPGSSTAAEIRPAPPAEAPPSPPPSGSPGAERPGEGAAPA